MPRDVWGVDHGETAPSGNVEGLGSSGFGHPLDMRRMLTVARDLGARNVRTFTRHRGTTAEMMERTVVDLKTAVADAARLGIDIVLENHEEFTGDELLRVVAAVGSPWLGVVFDYGNSQVVFEDPTACLETLLPFVRAVHLKDHLILRPKHSPDGRLSILGVPIGDGALPVMEMTRCLIAAGLRRLTLQSVWSYRAPVEKPSPGHGVCLGRGSFRFAEAPFDNQRFVPDRAPMMAADPARFCAMEMAAVDRGAAWLRRALADAGIVCKAMPDRTVVQGASERC